MTRILPAVLAVMLLGSCSLLPSGGGYDGAWRLLTGTLRGGAITPVEGAPLTLTLAGAEVSGSAGCNSYGGDVTIDGDRLAFGDLFQTLIGCDVELAEAESMFMEALRATERARRDGNRLTLTGNESELVFELVPPPADVSLVDTTWRLETVVDGDAAVSFSGADAVQATFADGGVTITVGCRVVAGTYTQDGGRATAGALEIADVALCDPNASAVQGGIAEALAGGFSAAVTGDRLQVTTSSGTGLEFRADR